MRCHSLAAAGLALSVAMASTALAQDAARATAALEGPEGNRVGQATLTQMKHGVLVRVEFAGLPAGWHAVHIHETGRCEPPFASASGHLSPGGDAHGYDTDGLHAGDLPNIHVGTDGTGKAEFFNPRISLVDRKAADQGFLNEAIGPVRRVVGANPANILRGTGAALIVHAKSDDYRSNPAGDAGDRIACGVIQPGGAAPPR